jgi:hypothetical protein
LLSQFEYEMRNHPDKGFYFDLIEESGWSKGLNPLPVAIVRLLRQKDEFEINNDDEEKQGYQNRECGDDETTKPNQLGHTIG